MATESITLILRLESSRRRKVTADRCWHAAGNIALGSGNNDEEKNKPGIERVHHSLTFHVRGCCHSNETHAPVANPPNSAQLQG